MDLAERLLNPETVEAALKEFGAEWQYKTVVRELHERLKTAKADLARKDRTIIALEELRRQTEYVHSEQIKEKEILAYDTGKELEAALVALATAKAEGAAEALDEAAQYFYDEGLPGSLALKDRATAIRKAAAKEAK